MTHGSSAILIVALMTGFGLSGCVVHQHQAPAPDSTSQQRQQSAAKSANSTPATGRVAIPAPSPSPVPSPAAPGRTYTIRPGDKLWNISKDVYGDGTKYQRILDANPGLNPDNMKPGTRIVIP